MSLWDLRETMETAIPWWGPLAIAGIAGLFYVAAYWWMDR